MVNLTMEWKQGSYCAPDCGNYWIADYGDYRIMVTALSTCFLWEIYKKNNCMFGGPEKVGKMMPDYLEDALEQAEKETISFVSSLG